MTLEELLNTLIQRGWKPRGHEMHWIHCSNNRFTLYLPNMRRWDYSIRDLVSKESWLWQFVCKNGMVEEESFQYIEDKEICTSDEWKCYYNDDWYPRDNYYTLDRTDAEFWIIESALIDESKLESFILDNINV